jgi:hypothetical protein
VVFGCGGDRDPGKRPLMGQVAGELADLPIATSDNPRSEDPLAILSAVERAQGERATASTGSSPIGARRSARRRGGVDATGDWAVLVAGKGHEEEQIFADRRVRFSDREELAAAVEERLGSSAAWMSGCGDGGEVTMGDAGADLAGRRARFAQGARRRALLRLRGASDRRPSFRRRRPSRAAPPRR